MATASLRIGMSGTSIMTLQNLLNQVIPVSPSLIADGIFGPKTQARVIAFQRKMGLVADGVVGPLTMRAIVLSILDRSSNRNSPR